MASIRKQKKLLKKKAMKDIAYRSWQKMKCKTLYGCPCKGKQIVNLVIVQDANYVICFKSFPIKDRYKNSSLEAEYLDLIEDENTFFNMDYRAFVRTKKCNKICKM